jgi:asparagine N-glycosylation enzyme membrane subunit Stt3
VIPKSRDVDKWKQVKELGKQMPNIDEEIIDAEFAELPYINEPEQESENTENRSETIEKIFKQLADIYNIYISSILDNITSIYTSSHFSQDEKKVIKDYHRKFQGFMEKLKYIYDPPRINKQEKEYKLSTEDAIEVTEALCESISERAPSATLPSIESERYKDWLLWMKKTGDKYSKGKEELLEIIAWIRNDTGNNKFPGWGAVIQSTKTFYEKFSSIETQFRFNQGKKEGSVEINVSEPIDDEYDGGV